MSESKILETIQDMINEFKKQEDVLADEIKDLEVKVVVAVYNNAPDRRALIKTQARLKDEVRALRRKIETLASYL